MESPAFRPDFTLSEDPTAPSLADFIRQAQVSPDAALAPIAEPTAVTALTADVLTRAQPMSTRDLYRQVDHSQAVAYAARTIVREIDTCL